jgi:hypothetical protein
MLTLREKTKRLTALPAPGFAPQMTITVADSILLESAAPFNGVAVAVLQQCLAGTAGTQEDLDRVRRRLAFIKKGLQKVAGFSKNRFSPESLAARLASPFFLTPGTTLPKLLTLAQQAKANAVSSAPAGAKYLPIRSAKSYTLLSRQQNISSEQAASFADLQINSLSRARLEASSTSSDLFIFPPTDGGKK